MHKMHFISLAFHRHFSSSLPSAHSMLSWKLLKHIECLVCKHIEIHFTCLFVCIHTFSFTSVQWNLITSTEQSGLNHWIEICTHSHTHTALCRDVPLWIDKNDITEKLKCVLLHVCMCVYVCCDKNWINTDQHKLIFHIWTTLSNSVENLNDKNHLTINDSVKIICCLY